MGAVALLNPKITIPLFMLVLFTPLIKFARIATVVEEDDSGCGGGGGGRAGNGDGLRASSDDE
ncbi:conserved hypothetical protein [Ricinus communis]|uniref:Uncharacterized protein n=1 Tax=Ricinus communis TaxID=3988 RepID=B9S3F3_RICCO|nr:conserved hypothetical protein [Ricinus communis]